MRINDGSIWVQGKDWSKDHKALNIECAAKDKGGVSRALKATYSSATTKFPLHVQMRFVPVIQLMCALDSLTKFWVLVNQQDRWCTQHQAKTCDDGSEIDAPLDWKNSRKTLCDLIYPLHLRQHLHPSVPVP